MAHGMVFAQNEEEGRAFSAVIYTMDRAVTTLLERVRAFDLTAAFAAFDLYKMATEPGYVVQEGFGTIDVLRDLGIEIPLHSLTREVIAAGLYATEDGIAVWNKPHVTIQNEGTAR